MGALYAGVFNFELDDSGKPRRIPTNYTYGVAAHYIVNALPQVLANEAFKADARKNKPMRQIFENEQAVNNMTGERMRVSLPW